MLVQSACFHERRLLSLRRQALRTCICVLGSAHLYMSYMYQCVHIYVCYIGSAHLDFFKAMEAEHCVRAGCDELFETLNYRIRRHISRPLPNSIPLPQCPFPTSLGLSR